MKAIKIVSTGDGGQEAALQDVPVPELREGFVLCKVLCVGLNPTDWLGSSHTPASQAMLILSQEACRWRWRHTGMHRWERYV